jgi:hypothetical protein
MKFKKGQIVTSLVSYKTHVITKIGRSFYHTHLLDDKNKTYSLHKDYVENNFIVVIPDKTRYICMDCGKRDLMSEETKNHHLKCKEDKSA